jgi:hypothetical protein
MALSPDRSLQMTPNELHRAVHEHRGTLLCSRIHDPSQTKAVEFKHETTPAGDLGDIPDIGRLRQFYEVFGSITFYLDDKSGDAARYIAQPSQWASLRDHFAGWLDGIDDEEDDEYTPTWAKTCLVIGEEPRSGNYILMPTEGEEAGAVYHFEHDGFEFDRQADDLLEYAASLLDLDDAGVTQIAGHMRFIEGDDHGVQWWIEELRDNRGNVARTAS